MIAPLRIIIAAVFGSASGSAVWYAISGTPEEIRFYVALGGGSLMFTLLGALMLMVLQHVLLERRLSTLRVGATLLITGGFVGGLVLGLIGIGIYLVEGPYYTGYVVGAVYGALTAIPLLVLKPPAEANPAAIR